MAGRRRIGTKTVNTGLTLTPKVLEAGRMRAREERRSFSAHVEFLLQQDLDRGPKDKQDESTPVAPQTA